ncbi:MAG TPA: CHAD domain-containing protein [Gemmatimonadales bacterium]|nr:CHAD domain-containing protein [Gemmatimonadales bacterium]
MDASDTLLDRPAGEAARILALRLLDAAGVARIRLARPDDPEALHDFRVAIRRLRSCLRAWRVLLEGSISGRTRRHLRRLARATGRSRDLEVHLTWVAAQAGAVREYQRPGLAWLEVRLRERQARAEPRLARALQRDYAAADANLRRRLPVYRATIEPHPPTAAAALAPLVVRLAGELEARLALVHSIASQVEIHEVRIAAKRLRYLLEPFAPEAEGIPSIVERLKTLQDVLGALHDAHVFAGELAEALEAAAVAQAQRVSRELLHWTPDAAEEGGGEDPRPGLVALASRLREIAEQAFARFQTEWLAGGAAGFFADVAELTARLTARGAVGREIERKYLLSGLPPVAGAVPPLEIEQGWLPGERLVERLRWLRSNGSDAWFRTIKAGVGLTRLEVEEETSREFFAGMWPLTEGRRIRKRRYRVPDGQLVWEIDEFVDRELVLAEIELPAPTVAAPPPEWLAPYVVREVTGEPEYLNQNLAR